MLEKFPFGSICQTIAQAIRDYMDQEDRICHPNLLIELSFHYLRSNNFQELKQLLLDIETFSTLFRSQTKILYLKFWHIIEVFGYEPIAEMVK